MHPLTTTEDAEARMARAASYPDLSPQTHLDDLVAAFWRARGRERVRLRGEVREAMQRQRTRRAALMAAARRLVERSAA